ncbi:MAG TPA: hypothetical protein VHL34_24730 [Rhizomicrobium sp.]|jgi:hypothetical protein|nr:hypothetical protein [Rhizomicrobium sp.]
MTALINNRAHDIDVDGEDTSDGTRAVYQWADAVPECPTCGDDLRPTPETHPVRRPAIVCDCGQRYEVIQ